MLTKYIFNKWIINYIEAKPEVTSKLRLCPGCLPGHDFKKYGKEVMEEMMDKKCGKSFSTPGKFLEHKLLEDKLKLIPTITVF